MVSHLKSVDALRELGYNLPGVSTGTRSRDSLVRKTGDSNTQGVYLKESILGTLRET